MQQAKPGVDVLIVLPGLTPGGAERVVTNVVNDWVKRGIRICVVLLTQNEHRFYNLDSQVEIVVLDDLRSSKHWVKFILGSLRHIITLRHCLVGKKPRALIAFLPALNVISLLASWNLPIRTIVSERNDIRMRRIPLFWRVMRRLTYRFADTVTINLSTNRKLLEQYVSPNKIVYLPNPVQIPPPTEREKPRKKTILAVGRLSRQKGYDLLIPAYANSRCRLNGWELLIVGDGEELSSLKNLIDHLGLQSCVFIRPPIENLWLEFGDSGVFVMPSRFEGMPNALLEAIAHGLVPLVSDGVGDLTKAIAQIDQRLVFPSNSELDLTHALDWLTVEQLDKEQTYPQVSDILVPYASRNSMPQWDRLITDLLN